MGLSYDITKDYLYQEEYAKGLEEGRQQALANFQQIARGLTTNH